jgi:single-strand DNA-binding protein
MSFSNINRVVLVARLTRDPELRALPSGQSVCSLRVACNGSRRDSDGDFQERPNYFDVSAFGMQAESISRYTRRGSLVAIDGRLEWREWETAEQQRRQAVSIVAESVEFLGSPEADEPRMADADAQQGGDGTGAQDDDAEQDGGAEQDIDAQDRAEQEEPEQADGAAARAEEELVF